MRSLGVLLVLAVATACMPDGSGDPPTGTADAAPGSADAAPGGEPDAVPSDAGGAYWQAGGELAERVCPPDSFLTLDNFGSGFLSEYCLGCHSSEIPMNMRQGAPEGIDFDTMDGLRVFAPRIYARSADGYDTMPPAGGPDATSRILFGEWLACGMPL